MPQHKNQLSAVIKGRGQAGFSEYEVLKIFCDVCESLALLHCCQAPVIYRDLKVENVVQNDMGRFILAESSAATTRFLNPAAHGKKAVEDEIQKNTTQAYRAPEMIDLNSGHSITTKSDIWALGCLLYRLCFGSLPFGESSKAIVHCQYNIPEKCKYSPELCQLVRFLLEADPEKRPSIYQVCEFAFKISGKDNPLRIARERQKSCSNNNNHNSDYSSDRKHQHQNVASTAPISVSTSVAPRSRPKGQHSGTGSGFSLGPPPLNPSPKNVVSPVPGVEPDSRQNSGPEKTTSTGTPFVANFSENFPTVPAKHIAKSPAGLSIDLQPQSAGGDTQRSSNDTNYRRFSSDAKLLLVPSVEPSAQKDKSATVSPLSLLSPFEPEPPSSSSSSTRPRPTTLQPAPQHHHSKSSTSSSQHRHPHHHHVLSNSNSEKSLVSPVSSSTWNPFGDASPFSPNSTLMEDQLFGAEFDKLRLEGGSQTSIVTSPEEMKSESTSWLRRPQQRQQRFSLPTLTQAASTGMLPTATTVEVVPEEDPFGSAPFTLPKRVKDKAVGKPSKLTSKLSEVIAGAAGGGVLWRHSAGGGGGKESLISSGVPGVVNGENGREGAGDEGAADKSALLGIKLDDLISGGEKGSPNFIKLPLDDRNKYEKLNSNDVTSDDSDLEFYPDSTGGQKKQSFKQFVENNIPEKLQAVYHKVDKGQIKNVQIVKKLRGKVDGKKGSKGGRSKDKHHVKDSVGGNEYKEGESDDSIGSASDLRANDDFPEGEEDEHGKTVAGKPSKKLNRMAFGDGSVDDCISESIKTCGSSAYHAECESVTTNEDNTSRIVTRVRVKKREHDSKHSVIDEDDSGEEDMIQGDKPLLLDDELDYESAAENNTSGEEVLMDPFTPESLPDESEKLTEEDEIDLDPFAMAPFKKPAVPKRNSIKYMPNVNLIPENCPTIPAPPLPPTVESFCTSTPLKPPRSQPEPSEPPPILPVAPVAAPEPAPFCDRSPNARTDLFGSEPFPSLVLSPPLVAVRPMPEAAPIPTVTVQSGSVALTHIIPNTKAALPIVIPLEPVPPPPPPIVPQKQPQLSPHQPMNARTSYINFSQIPTQTIGSISPDNNYVNFQADYDEDDDVRKLKSDEYDDSSDTVVKSSSKSGGFLSKKEKVKYNSLKDHKISPGKEDSGPLGSILGGGSSGSAGNHTAKIPVKLSQKVKVNVGGYKKVSAKGSKKDKSNGAAATAGAEAERYEDNGSAKPSSKACKKMGFSNMSFEDFPSDEPLDDEHPQHRSGGGGGAAGGIAQRLHAPFEVIRNERTLLEAEKKFGSLKRRSNPFS